MKRFLCFIGCIVLLAVAVFYNSGVKYPVVKPVRVNCAPSEFHEKYPDLVKGYKLEKLLRPPYSEVSQSDKWHDKFIYAYVPDNPDSFGRSRARNYKLAHMEDCVESVGTTFIVFSNSPLPDKKFFKVGT